MRSAISERRVEGQRSCVTRRRVGGLIAAAAGFSLLAGCDDGKWHAIDVSGTLPALEFGIARAPDGKVAKAADYRGRIVLLYFGYTNCPDVCPTTLANLADVLQRIGAGADRVRILFVTVDPNRDTLPLLAEYVRAFSPQIEGLRGTPDQLATLARRYRIVYSVSPETKDHPYEVTHSSAIYVFDGSGAARLLIASMATTTPDISGTVADLRRLIEEKPATGLVARLLRLV